MSKFENGYDDNICIPLGNDYYERGSKVDIQQLGIEPNCILAVKYFNDEEEEEEQLIYLLIENEVYINFFYSVKKIQGNERFNKYKLTDDLNWELLS